MQSSISYTSRPTHLHSSCFIEDANSFTCRKVTVTDVSHRQSVLLRPSVSSVDTSKVSHVSEEDAYWYG